MSQFGSTRPPGSMGAAPREMLSADPSGGAAGAPALSAPVPPTPAPAEPRYIELRDPLVAGFLAWLLPGLGHWYQGRRSKAALFFVCVFGTFVYGLWLGEGRVVYASFRENDMRLSFICQAGVGLPTIPALLQSKRFQNPDLWAEKLLREHNEKPLFFDKFMAPPLLHQQLAQLRRREGLDKIIDDKFPRLEAAASADELSKLHKELHHYFELGSLYTMIAGLLNMLVIYDAVAGPAFSAPPDRKESTPGNPPLVAST